ncbi:MAG: hypothetical protein QW103_00035 [Candidatus Pacearchaeota archaeon]
MEKTKYRAKTIDDLFVVEGLCAVSQLEKEQKTKETWFIVGGMATQSYLPSFCRRPTSDIDLALLKPLTYSDFKDYCKPIKEYLQDRGFLVEERKGHNAYILIYENKEEEKGIIEFARRNEKNISRIIKRLEKEMENSRIKLIEGRNEVYRVSSPEDIVSPKIVRGIRTLRDYEELKEYLDTPYPLTNERITEDLRKIEEIRSEARLLEGDLSLAARLRFVSDIYDIRVLSELTGFNKEYLKESLNRWENIKGETPEKKILFEKILPFIKID